MRITLIRPVPLEKESAYHSNKSMDGKILVKAPAGCWAADPH